METQRKQEEKGNRSRHLRNAAEEKLARSSGASPEMKKKTLEELVHELRVHQIELEMQNEELKKAHLALEASRDKYVDLYDFAPAGYFTFTHGALVTEVNLTGAALLGVARQKLINSRFRRFVAPEDVERWDRHILSVFQQGKKQSCELVLKREDGSTFHARLDSIRLDLPDGQEQAGLSAKQAGVSGKTPVVCTAVSDITERKRAEETLRENKEKYRELVESISDVIYEIDERGKFTYVSAVTRDVLGYEPEDLVGRGFIEFVHPEDRDLLVRRFSKLTQGIEYPLEYRGMAKSDEVRWVRTRTKPMMKGNAFSGARGTLIDITERKRAEEVLRRSEEEARRLAQENAIVGEIGRIISSTLNIEEIYERFAGEMHKLIDFERVAMNIIDPEERTFIISYVSGPQVADRRTGDVIPLAGTGTEEIMRTRSSLFILDKDWESVISRCPGLSPIFKAGFQSVMMVPLISKNDVIGVLNIQSTRPNAYTQTDLRIAERIGIQISGAIASAQLFAEHRRTETIIQEQLGFLQVLINTIPSPIFYKDREGKFLGCNKAWEQMNGLKREQIIGKTVYDVAPPELAAIYRAQDEELLSRGGVQIYEVSVTSTEGKKHDVIFNKASFTKADGSVGGLVGVITDISERKRAAESMRESEERYRSILDNIEDGYFEVDLAGNFTFFNDSLCRGLGYSKEEMMGMNNRQYMDKETAKKVYEAFNRVYTTGEPYRAYNWGIIRKDGLKRFHDSSISLIKNAKGERIGFRGVARDVTEKKKAEEEMAALQEQLRQSQKMEAIGRLAGGIAHDFNNLLTIIKGYSQLSLLELKEGDPLRGNIDETQKATERAANLIRQLLAFSRRQVMEMEVLDLNTLLRDLEKMLRRVIGEDIGLVNVLAENLGKVKADPGQIEQVILNLAVNARDAMPNGGKLTIETTNVKLDEAYARAHIAVTPGRYVVLSVSDTGVGMTPEVKERIFEPFFTTKEKGKGTGLGLSTVYGIVKQSGGNIWVYSEPGKGTAFKIYLPRVDEPLEELKSEVEVKEIPRGSETILIVEDEEEVRKVAVRMLEKQGYTVLEARQEEEALLCCEQRKEPIHLILTDVVMPQMSGPQLIDRSRQVRQDFKVLYMSGYADNAIVRNGILEEGVNYIQKPFSMEGLARKVREVLDK